eukprot:1273345-Pleurochrysis_carterae.AAC.4
MGTVNTVPACDMMCLCTKQQAVPVSLRTGGTGKKAYKVLSAATTPACFRHEASGSQTAACDGQLACLDSPKSLDVINKPGNYK